MHEVIIFCAQYSIFSIIHPLKLHGVDRNDRQQ